MTTDAATILGANLDALPADVRLAVERAAADGFVQLDATGPQLSATVLTPDGRRVRIHSGRDPVTEADRYLDRVLAGSATPVVIVINPGLGYVVEAIERRAPGTRIIAIEPFPAVARALLERRDWREWIESRRLTLLLGRDYLGASEAWKLLDHRAPASTIIELAVLKREFPEETARARGLAEHIVKGAQSNADARKKFAGRYLLNTLTNLPALVVEGDASSLVDLFPAVPAIIVAAGPSLDDNIQHLRALHGRALIVAVDTALRPLRASGIRPHLVVAVDPSERNAMHLIGADSDGSWLVSEGSVDPGVVPEFTGRVFGFKVSDHHPWPWLRTLGFERGTLRAWGSVVTTAFDLACRMGCDPIVFIGTDLSYTDGLHYCRSTIHEGAGSVLATTRTRVEAFAGWMREHDRPTCTETDLRGAAVVSTPDFVQFRNWLVSRAVAVRPRRVLNATGAGILYGDGIAQANLGSISFPPLTGGDERIRARLRASWDESRNGRRQFLPDLERGLARPGRDGVPLDTWLAFAGDTASSQQIISCVERGWRTPPRILHQPVSLRRMPGWTASFTIAATGGPAPAVQWQISTDDGVSWSDIAGATATTHAFTMTTGDIGNQFRAVCTNTTGSATSAVATVEPAVTGVSHDFNGDGKPDLLWRHAVSGIHVVWYLDGVTRTGMDGLDVEGDLAWRIAGTADFNGDGQPDIVWRNLATGANRVWYMDGVSRTGVGLIDAETDLAWTIVGIGDFNGDGKPDLLWRNTVTGDNRLWYMDGVTRTGLGVLDAEHDLNWQITGTGDFKGDGTPDIVWRHSLTGANRVWYMDLAKRTGLGLLDAETDLGWRIAGTADFNGDGKPDLLWSHAVTGANVLWYLDGLAKVGTASLETVLALDSTAVELNWQISALG